ncbi:MAG: hypothetical protein MUP99_15040, partial [Pedobacter sp.]|nr:hypothetical protein [Pedobacter sp.]
MGLLTNLRIKVFYFEMEILQEQSHLQKNGLPCSLKAVKSRLTKITSEIYLKSNLLVTESFYQQNPFRLSIVMEGKEYKMSEAVSLAHSTNFYKEKFTVEALELICSMSPPVKR